MIQSVVCLIQKFFIHFYRGVGGGEEKNDEKILQ